MYCLYESLKDDPQSQFCVRGYRTLDDAERWKRWYEQRPDADMSQWRIEEVQNSVTYHYAVIGEENEIIDEGTLTYDKVEQILSYDKILVEICDGEDDNTLTKKQFREFSADLFGGY